MGWSRYLLIGAAAGTCIIAPASEKLNYNSVQLDLVPAVEQLHAHSETHEQLHAVGRSSIVRQTSSTSDWFAQGKL
jgi:hypothetical protein